MFRSTYQLSTGVSRFWITSIAAPLTVIGDIPGGADRHFWVPL